MVEPFLAQFPHASLALSSSVSSLTPSLILPNFLIGKQLVWSVVSARGGGGGGEEGEAGVLFCPVILYEYVPQLLS
jgi:hypothetical protein